MSNEEKRLAAEVFGNGQQQKEQQSIGAMEAVTEGFKEFKDNMTPGLTWDKFVRDIGQMLHQKGVQGLAELASALYTGQSFVPYGQGQWMKGQQGEKAGTEPDHGLGNQGMEQDQQMKRGMSL